MTDPRNLEKLKELNPYIAQQGWKNFQLIEFKTHDRIITGDAQLKMTVTLRGKLYNTPLEKLWYVFDRMGAPQNI